MEPRGHGTRLASPEGPRCVRPSPRRTDAGNSGQPSTRATSHRPLAGGMRRDALLRHALGVLQRHRACGH
eukprot:1555301-Pyramimonas_sp.AAC.1